MPLTRADYVLLFLEKCRMVPSLTIDDVVRLAEAVGLPIKTPDLWDDILTLQATGEIRIDPKTRRYTITNHGKKTLNQIKRRLTPKLRMMLEHHATKQKTRKRKKGKRHSV